jgi:predicted RecB family nuclease
MRKLNGQLRVAATDVATFAACAHATTLDVGVAEGRLSRPYLPRVGDDLLRERGLAHERTYFAKLQQTHAIEEMPADTAEALARTVEAMQRGVDVIYQGALQYGQWLGRPDFLRRVDRAAGLWPWSYEPVDAKLARSAKPAALLQMCFYAELLSRTQGAPPARMVLVLGDGREEPFLTSRYAAYFRYVRACFERAIGALPVTYPEPVEHCDACDWIGECEARRRKDDHLSLVAGITTSQRRALENAGVRTVTELATVPLGPPLPIDGIELPALTRLREQARIQVEGRGADRLVYELLPGASEGRGLGLLPPPSAGDVFMDFEGDPYALGDGLEYLLGILEPNADTSAEPQYTPFWAFDAEGERVAFERLMLWIAARRAQYPDMHVYHYAPYEPTALKRLAGRHAAAVDELDKLLRGQVFVDLYAVVRQGLRASVESYSIKCLEPLYEFERSVPLREARRSLAAFEAWVELRDSAAAPQKVVARVEGYNRDDCVSAMRLREWLEERRGELEANQGAPLSRPAVVADAPNEALAEQLTRVHALESTLLARVSEDPEARTEDQQARYVMAHLLDWHRREDKSVWWEYFRLCDLSDDDRRQERSPLSGLTYEGIVGSEKRSQIHRYRFPPQDHAVDRALEVHDPQTKKRAGDVVRLDDAEGIVELRRGVQSPAPHPTSLVPMDLVRTPEQRESLLRLGGEVSSNGPRLPGQYRAASSLLRRESVRDTTRGERPSVEASIVRALALDGAVLPVQGPPGTGKTYQGARMIVALLKAGKRVGITANSHKVITKLLDEACSVAEEQNVAVCAMQKAKDDESGSRHPAVRVVDDNGEIARALATRTANLGAGTSWLWARAGLVASVDVLFVDEAGQMALANALAAAPAANGIVLLGDPQQLEQPQKGMHPPGTAASALGHMLGEAATLPVGQGLFLDETWRMHPDICTYISEVFYEGRLRSRPDLSAQRLDAPNELSGTGLRFVPVAHQGRENESEEEARAIAALIRQLVDERSTWTDRHGRRAPLRLADILVVAPYNAHVARIAQHAPGVTVGTVDKFQGQEAPVVIYSMATSSPEDAPRGMEFLYSGNRLNVAISRARCASFLVASPRLFDLRCKSVRQIELASAFCRYLESAREVRADPAGAQPR